MRNGNSSSDDSNVEVKMKRRKITRVSPEDFSTDTSSEIISFHRLSTRCNMSLSSSEDEEDEFSINNNNIATSHTDWSDSIGNQPRLIYTFRCYTRFQIIK